MSSVVAYGGIRLDLPRRPGTIVAISPALRPGIAVWKANGRFWAKTLDTIALDGHPTPRSVANMIVDALDGQTVQEVVCEVSKPSQGHPKYAEAVAMIRDALERLTKIDSKTKARVRYIPAEEIFKAHGSDWLDMKALEVKWRRSGFHDPDGTYRSSMALGTAWAAGLADRTLASVPAAKAAPAKKATGRKTTSKRR